MKEIFKNDEMNSLQNGMYFLSPKTRTKNLLQMKN